MAQNWWDRNWKWFLPLLCVACVVLFAGFIAAIMFAVFGMMKSSDAYVQALAKARATPAVVQALGEPIKEGYFVSGSINESGPSGRAELEIPVTGPRGDGRVFVVAQKSVGQWSILQLVVEIDSNHQRITLVDDKPAEAGQPGAPASY
ncbi:cytochrome c oxidase assembly factor Coa1 family protein [Andreprevotia chitinilytica]|uniref:cytochrome c oxidase assembly factor Coa1 family protein n=1 Tax=Andreprevotia chitinilytica TaxID=396808 RepID=UPI00068F6325|nr:cytochrome c oxidase assembly factor Coa1 family protein [Andreprevotia chitinilytica]